MTTPAAAAAAVYPLIAGPRSTGVVLGSFSQAVIIGLDTAGGPWALSLLGNAAAGVPNGIRMSGDRPDFADHRPGDPVRVGQGTVLIGALRIRVVRTWRSEVERIEPDAATISIIQTTATEAGLGVPLAAVDDLRRSLALREIGPAVDALVGLGSGLTPGGDDVLAGLLTGLHATGQTDLAGRIGDRALRGITDRTTLLSADLLRLAAAGHACVEVLAVLRAVRTGHQVPAALHRLVSIGHTSGADLATGLGMGLRCGRSMSRYEQASTTTR